VVLGWIRSGELRACNVAQRAGGRPRWRILLGDLAAFQAARSAQPPRPAARRRKATPGVITFF
jgi:hypothetical protein